MNTTEIGEQLNCLGLFRRQIPRTYRLQSAGPKAASHVVE